MSAFSSTNWSYDLQAGPGGAAGGVTGSAAAAATVVPYAAVSASFFDTLGAKPALGRTFVASDDDPAAPRTVVMSHGLADVRYRELERPRLDLYLPHRQSPAVAPERQWSKPFKWPLPKVSISRSQTLQSADT